MASRVVGGVRTDGAVPGTVVARRRYGDPTRTATGSELTLA